MFSYHGFNIRDGEETKIQCTVFGVGLDQKWRQATLGYNMLFYLLCQTNTMDIFLVIRKRQLFFKCVALRDLAPFVKFKKTEKHPWRNVPKLHNLKYNFIKSNTSPCVFSRFLNCTSPKALQIHFLEF